MSDHPPNVEELVKFFQAEDERKLVNYLLADQVIETNKYNEFYQLGMSDKNFPRICNYIGNGVFTANCLIYFKFFDTLVNPGETFSLALHHRQWYLPKIEQTFELQLYRNK